MGFPRRVWAAAAVSAAALALTACSSEPTTAGVPEEVLGKSPLFRISQAYSTEVQSTADGDFVAYVVPDSPKEALERVQSYTPEIVWDSDPVCSENECSATGTVQVRQWTVPVSASAAIEGAGNSDTVVTVILVNVTQSSS